MTVTTKIERLLYGRPVNWWEQLCQFIPELRALEGTPQPPEYHPEGDVAAHTRLAIEVCPINCDPDLLWVALLHDIGKPETTKHHEHGRITAHGHAQLGAEMAEQILMRLDMAMERRQRICWVIRHHTFHHSWQLDSPEDLTEKQKKYLKNPHFALLLEFLRIDTLASKGHTDGLHVYEFYRELWVSCSGER